MRRERLRRHYGHPFSHVINRLSLWCSLVIVSQVFWGTSSRWREQVEVLGVELLIDGVCEEVALADDGSADSEVTAIGELAQGR